MRSEKNISQHFENLTEDAKKYIESEVAYYKLDFYKKLILASSLLIRLLMAGALVLLCLTFLGIGLAMFLGMLIDNYYASFLIVSGIFLLLFFVVLYFAKPAIERSTISIFNKLFNS